MTRFKWGTVSDRTVQVPESRAFDFGVGWFVVCFLNLLLFVFWRDGGMSLFLRMRLMGEPSFACIRWLVLLVDVAVWQKKSAVHGVDHLPHDSSNP